MLSNTSITIFLTTFAFLNLLTTSSAQAYVDYLDSTELSTSDLLGNAAKPEFNVKLDAYLSYPEMTALIHRLQEEYPDLVRVRSIGKSSRGLDLWAVEVTRNVRQERQLLKPMFKYVANMHGDETVGYALMVNITHTIHCSIRTSVSTYRLI